MLMELVHGVCRGPRQTFHISVVFIYSHFHGLKFHLKDPHLLCCFQKPWTKVFPCHITLQILSCLYEIFVLSYALLSFTGIRFLAK